MLERLTSILVSVRAHILYKINDAQLNELINLLCAIDASEALLRNVAAQHGEHRAAQNVSVESLVDELNLVRRLFEQILYEQFDLFTKEEVFIAQSLLRARFDIVLSSSVGAYFRTHLIEARRDPVTGLPDRAAFEQAINAEIARADRYSRQLSLVLLDIDDFKAINDQFGHPAGDCVLARVGNVLRATLRRADQIFRYGGDEFAALCPEATVQSIARALWRVKQNLQTIESIPNKIGISWGAACFPIDAMESSDIVQLADERLYACKRVRRNHKKHKNRGSFLL